MTNFDKKQIFELGWQLLNERGLKGLTFENLNFITQIPISDLEKKFTSPAYFFCEMIKDLLPRLQSQQNHFPTDMNDIQDALFDNIMNFIDALDNKKNLLTAIYCDVLCEPTYLIPLKNLGQDCLKQILSICGIDLQKLSPIKNYMGLGFGLSILYTWLNDTTTDNTQTMAMVDKRIKQFMQNLNENLIDLVTRTFKFS